MSISIIELANDCDYGRIQSYLSSSLSFIEQYHLFFFDTADQYFQQNNSAVVCQLISTEYPSRTRDKCSLLYIKDGECIKRLSITKLEFDELFLTKEPMNALLEYFLPQFSHLCYTKSNSIDINKHSYSVNDSILTVEMVSLKDKNSTRKEFLLTCSDDPNVASILYQEDICMVSNTVFRSPYEKYYLYATKLCNFRNSHEETRGFFNISPSDGLQLIDFEALQAICDGGCKHESQDSTPDVEDFRMVCDKYCQGRALCKTNQADAHIETSDAPCVVDCHNSNDLSTQKSRKCILTPKQRRCLASARYRRRKQETVEDMRQKIATLELQLCQSHDQCNEMDQKLKVLANENERLKQLLLSR